MKHIYIQHRIARVISLCPYLDQLHVHQYARKYNTVQYLTPLVDQAMRFHATHNKLKIDSLIYINLSSFCANIHLYHMFDKNYK